MYKKLPVVFIRIHWEGCVERMRIDLAELQTHLKPELTTQEVWEGEKRVLVYSPRTTYHVDAKGTHVIELDYRQEDHVGSAFAEVPWGKSTIRIPSSCTSATADWDEISMPKSLDRRTYKVEFRLEKPSEKKAEVVSVRKAQARFKQELMKLGAVCALTGKTLPALLDAAHIQTVEQGGPDEPENGILLRADVHRLYDAGYFNIKPDGTLSLHRAIPGVYRTLFKGVKLQTDVIERIKPYLLKRKAVYPQGATT